MGTVTEATETPYGADLSGGFVWYEKGMEWAVEKGISDGSNPEALRELSWLRFSGTIVRI